MIKVYNDFTDKELINTQLSQLKIKIFKDWHDIKIIIKTTAKKSLGTPQKCYMKKEIK
jgi:hypothetical protein